MMGMFFWFLSRKKKRCDIYSLHSYWIQITIHCPKYNVKYLKYQKKLKNIAMIIGDNTWIGLLLNDNIQCVYYS